jgi:LPXTG-site transpeptidase (sortase) family protein
MVIVSLVGVLFSVVCSSLFMPVHTAALTKLAVPAMSPPMQQMAVGLPIRLKIPHIAVDAVVGKVGLTGGGLMDAPAGPSDTAWFDLGPLPGDTGSAVIDGHSGWKNNIPAVFDNLYKLNIGDKIYVEDTSGMTTTFVVRKIRTYEENADASVVFMSHDNHAHLNLVTCTGVWNEATKSSSKRLVVFADREI